jgi:4Fe-4S ferredoxin
MSRRPVLARGSAADCKQAPGVLMPVIDSHRCEGAGPCVQVCPVNVFDLRRLTRAERSALPLKARVKVWVHGGRQAFAVRADVCQGCGLCVSACPERAITLARNPGAVANVTPLMEVAAS